MPALSPFFYALFFCLPPSSSFCSVYLTLCLETFTIWSNLCAHAAVATAVVRIGDGEEAVEEESDEASDSDSDESDSGEESGGGAGAGAAAADDDDDDSDDDDDDDDGAVGTVGGGDVVGAGEGGSASDDY